MTSNNQETILINSIKKAADIEAKRILDDASRIVEDRKKSTNEQITKLKNDTIEKEKRLLDVIAQDGERKIASLKRKQLLELKEKIVNTVIERVKEKFNSLVSEPEFKEMMIEWSVEAALGLEESDAILKISDSCTPFANDAFCNEIARRYKEITDKKITLSLIPDAIQKGHGIMLEANNGKTAYNNLLENRLYRYKDKIEALVLEDVFNE